MEERIIKINVKDLKENPFNPKLPFSKTDKDFLKSSLEKWGLQGTLTVCKDYEEEGKYILLDGNSRASLLEGDVLCYVVNSIKNEKDLKEFVLDFCSAIKKKSDKKLKDLFVDLQLTSEMYKQKYADIRKMTEKYKEVVNWNENYKKILVLEFKNEENYIKFKNVLKGFCKKILVSLKKYKQFENLLNKDIDEIIEKNFEKIARIILDIF